MFRAVAGESNSERAKERRAMFGAIGLLTLVSAVVIAVAIWIAIDNGQDAPRNGPGGIHLTADEGTGRQLFARTCATCHTLSAVNAVARIGPDLDVLKPPKALVLYAIQHGFAGQGGQMPAGLYSGKDANDIASFVAAVAGR
jgi:mono/diheme cytochrome c family protein